MDAIYFIAFYPALLFVRQEFFYSMLTDVFQIINHAHLVFGPVALVQLFNPGTGEGVAFKAVLPLIFFQFGTVFNMAVSAAFLFVDVITSAPGAVFLCSNKSHAQRAIHATGGDEFFADGHVIGG